MQQHSETDKIPFVDMYDFGTKTSLLSNPNFDLHGP